MNSIDLPTPHTQSNWAVHGDLKKKATSAKVSDALKATRCYRQKVSPFFARYSESFLPNRLQVVTAKKESIWAGESIMTGPGWPLLLQCLTEFDWQKKESLRPAQPVRLTTGSTLRNWVCSAGLVTGKSPHFQFHLS